MEAERVPLQELGHRNEKINDEISIDFCNERSRIRRNKAEDSTTFIFNYENGSGETLNWKELRKLKSGKKWGVIRHPYILNYVNQKLIDCAFFYSLHILAFLVFFLLLAWHVFSRNLFKDFLITIFTGIFFMFLVLKGTIKARITKSVSTWFIVAFCFNIFTYMATLAYVWLPTVFGYDDYHLEVKKIVTWFLPIIAIISAWANLLYIMRKSPFGIYIFMMTRILRSFAHIATIWIPTLIAFSFAFLLIMRDTGVKPWPLIDQQTENMTMVQTMLVILQAVTKTSTMMIGEVDANDILDTNQWIPSILVLVFEIITVILLMNLMVSLAVGDVTYLNNTAQDKLLKIKVNFVIEALQISEQFQNEMFRLHTKKTPNVLVINSDGTYISEFDVFPHSASVAISDEAFKISFMETGMRLRIKTSKGRVKTATVSKCDIECIESTESGIPVIDSTPDSRIYEDTSSCWNGYAKWLIGLDWAGYLDI
ncbi:Ion_trans domain-containing protein [Caenorhabditis elegans]|uniref:Ion_trans domain-containing protein n=1 Tax=Caenorhabditis elegans TaxID=6239 RepID=Q21517_CAEEL|nr:Ion_trans domain-containing protein [Caenorhabditis elegans]CAA95836.1 Ion_trans domain-containing protein [Caenorhabditis elegans]|eukprot:NP_492031.1 TRPA cation channel homolog [Caenorhabditis elegans]